MTGAALIAVSPETVCVLCCPTDVTTQDFLQLRLLDKSQSPGDQSARATLRDQLIEFHRAIAEERARRHFANWGDHLGGDEDDFVSEALIVLVGAVDEFEPERGVPFRAFLSERIAFRLRAYARDRASLVPRRSAGRGVEALPLDEDAPAFATPDFAAQWTQDESLKQAVEEAMRAAKVEVERGSDRDRAAWDRQREALTMRFQEEATFLAIGMRFNITTEAARKLVERGLDRLRPHLYLELYV